MFIYEFVNFFSYYSQDAIIVSILVAIVSIIIDKFLTLKQKLYIKVLTPFLIGIMIYFLYNAITNNQINFNFDIVLAGIFCGILSSSIYAFLVRLLNGKTDEFDFVLLTIEGLIRDFVNKEIITDVSKQIKIVFQKEKQKDNCVTKIKEIIEKNKNENINSNDIEFISVLLYESVKKLNLC